MKLSGLWDQGTNRKASFRKLGGFNESKIKEQINTQIFAGKGTGRLENKEWQINQNFNKTKTKTMTMTMTDQGDA